MSFSKKLQKYENDFFKLSWQSPSTAGYDAEIIGNSLNRPDSFSRYAGLKKFKATDYQNIKKVYSCLNDPAEIVRYGAVRCLARIEGKQADAHLRQALQDDSCHVRVAALQVIGENGNADFYSDVAPLLADKVYRVRLTAAITMQKVDEYEPHIHLINMLEDPSKQNRLAAMERLADAYDFFAVGPLFHTSKTDKDPEVREQAARAVDHLLDHGVLQRAREYVFRPQAEDDLEDVVWSLLMFDHDKSTELVRDILASRLMEVEGLDSEREADLFSSIAYEFVARYQETKNTFYVDDLLNVMASFSHNLEVQEDLTHILASSGSEYVLQQAADLLLNEGQYACPLKIILAMGGAEALNVLDQFCEQNGVAIVEEFIFDDKENTKRFIHLMSQEKSAASTALAARFFDQDFLELASDETKKLCLVVAGKAKAKKLAPRIAEILLSPEEGMLVRRKAALALGEIQGARAIKALEKVQQDTTASRALKNIAKTLLAQLSE